MSNPVQIIDSAVAAAGEVLLSAAEAALIVQYPILGLPIIKQIWEFLLSKLEAQIVVQVQNGANIFTISFIDRSENLAAISANENLKAVQGDVNATDAQKAQALKDFQDAYAKLIGFDNLT